MIGRFESGESDVILRLQMPARVKLRLMQLVGFCAVVMHDESGLTDPDYFGKVEIASGFITDRDEFIGPKGRTSGGVEYCGLVLAS